MEVNPLVMNSVLPFDPRPSDGCLEFLRTQASGKTLNIGTGAGHSIAALQENPAVTSIFTMDNLPDDFPPPPGVSELPFDCVMEDQGFDTVFIDHMGDRWACLLWWMSKRPGLIICDNVNLLIPHGYEPFLARGDDFVYVDRRV